jgi:hypothetical protein
VGRAGEEAYDQRSRQLPRCPDGRCPLPLPKVDTPQRMSDELRSAPGHRPEQRRNRGAPSWWAELERADLPQDDSDSTSHPAPARNAPRRPRPVRSSDRLARWRAAAIGAVAVLIAVAMCIVAIGGGSARAVVAVVLVFGVPAALAVVTATVIVRRSG